MLKVEGYDGPITGSTPEILRKRLGVDEIGDQELAMIRSANRRGVPIYYSICPYGQELYGVNGLLLDENLERLEEEVYQRSMDI